MSRWGWRLGLGVGLALAACAPDEGGSEDVLGDLPEQQISNFYTNRSRGGVLNWELWGESATKYPGESTMHLTRVRMVFYSNGVKDAELHADSGQVDNQTQDTVARGNVILTNVAGRQLRSEVLYWSNAEELIHTDQFVEITDGDQIMTGVGLRTDPNLTDAEILESVEGVIFEAESPPDREKTQ